MKQFFGALLVCAMIIALPMGTAFAVEHTALVNEEAALEDFQGEWTLFRMGFGCEWMKPEDAGYQGLTLNVEGETAQVIFRKSPMDFSCAMDGWQLKMDTDYDDRYDTGACLHADGTVIFKFQTPFGPADMHVVPTEMMDGYDPDAYVPAEESAEAEVPAEGEASAAEEDAAE